MATTKELKAEFARLKAALAKAEARKRNQRKQGKLLTDDERGALSPLGGMARPDEIRRYRPTQGPGRGAVSPLGGVARRDVQAKRYQP